MTRPAESQVGGSSGPVTGRPDGWLPPTESGVQASCRATPPPGGVAPRARYASRDVAEQVPITADDVYSRVLDLVQEDGLTLAIACARLGREMGVDPALVRQTALVVAQREDAVDLLEPAARR